MGTVYLVGAGPGDGKLITVRGFELIQKADVIIYDFLVNRELLDAAKNEAELIYVGKQASRHELPQHKINDLITRKAGEKEIVVRLKGGDPFIFGRGGEEAQVLADRGIPFEIVPGITSAIAAPAYAGIPLTHRDFASTVAFVTGHEDEKKKESTIQWGELAKGPDTLVFLMGMKNLTIIKDRLIAGGRSPDTQACLIQWGTLPKQRVVSARLSDIDKVAKKEGIGPPAIILVGEVINLRSQLRWFERRPLFGKKVVVTRAPHQSVRLGQLLTERGADVLYVPTIEIRPIKPNRRLIRALRSMNQYTFLVFTSTNGVSAFFDTLFSQGKDARILKGIDIIAIGGATASHLRSFGVIPDYVPDVFTSEGIIDTLRALPIEGRRFLIPRAEEARDVLTKYILDRGGFCDVIPVYKATLPAEKVFLPDKPDIITFTSSSTARNFLTLYGEDFMREATLASIGPVTTRTLERMGFPPRIRAKRFDIPGLVEAIEEYVSQ